ncbi:MAG: DUF370 domain-containing protein [Clostridia bacterium]|nr:DUF370 domain-containing protein [Clostridia bacterium]
MQFVDIGFGNRLAVNRILAVVHPDSMPVKRLIAEAREKGMLIDATQGRKTEGVAVTDSGHVVLSYFTPDRIMTAVETAEKEEEVQ